MNLSECYNIFSVLDGFWIILFLCLLILLVTMTLAVLAGCAQLKSISFEKKHPEPLESFVPQDLSAKSLSVKYVPKIESFVIILDASASMETAYTGLVNKGHTKFD